MPQGASNEQKSTTKTNKMVKSNQIFISVKNVEENENHEIWRNIRGFR